MSGCIDVDAYEQAKELGVEVVEADNWHLQVDLDMPGGECGPCDYDEKVLAAREHVLREYCKGEPLVTRSRNGNQHIYLALKESTDVEARIALQLALGSDPVREMLALTRARTTKRPPLVLFETKAGEARVRQFLCDRWKDGAK